MDGKIPGFILLPAVALIIMLLTKYAQGRRTHAAKASVSPHEQLVDQVKVFFDHNQRYTVIGSNNYHNTQACIVNLYVRDAKNKLDTEIRLVQKHRSGLECRIIGEGEELIITELRRLLKNHQPPVSIKLATWS